MVFDPLGTGKRDRKNFDSIFGKGSYDEDTQWARRIGSGIGTAKRLKALREKAEKEAEAERKKLEKEAEKAAEEKAEADKLKKEAEAYKKKQDKNKGNGFLGKIGDGIGDLFDGAKDTGEDIAKGAKKIVKKQAKEGKKVYKSIFQGLNPFDDVGVGEALNNLSKTKSVDNIVKTKKALKETGKSILETTGAAGKAAFQGFNPLDDVSMEEAFDNYSKRKVSKATTEIERASKRTVDSASLKLMSNLEKKVKGNTPEYTKARKLGEGGGTDMVSEALGYLVPGTGAAKALRSTSLGSAVTRNKALSLKGIGARSAEGAILGGGLTAGEVGIREAINPEGTNAEQNMRDIGKNALLGGLLDPIADIGLSKASSLLKGKEPELLGLPAPTERLGLPGPLGKIGGPQGPLNEPEEFMKIEPREIAKRFKQAGMKKEDAALGYERISAAKSVPMRMSIDPVAASAQGKGKIVDHRGELRKASEKSSKLAEGRLSSLFTKGQKLVSDDQIYIRVAENDLKGRSRMAGKGEVAQAFQLANGSAGKAEYLLERELAPVFSKLQKDGGETEKALEYITALHMQELNKELKGQYIFPGGHGIDYFDNIVEKYQGRPEYDEFSKGVSEYTNKMLDELKTSGILSDEAVKNMKGKYKNYVPKYRVKDLDTDKFEEAFFNDFSTISSKNPVKKIKSGSAEPLDDIVSSLQNMSFKTMQAAAKNNAIRKLATLVEKDTTGKWLSDGKKGNKIEYFDKGEKKEMFLSKELAEAVMDAAPLEIDNIQGFVRTLSKAQRFAITGSPAFVVRNAWRDGMQGWANSKSGFNAIDYGLGALDLITNGKFAGKNSNIQKFYESGAASSSIWTQDRNQFKKFQRQAFNNKKGFKDAFRVGDFMDWYREAVLEKSDNFSKMAEFRAAKRKGYSDEEAGYMARDMMDFFKAGSWTRKANPYVGFLNATVQGRSRFMRSFTEAAGEKDFKRGTRLVVRNAMAATVPSVLAYTAFTSLDDDDIRKKTIKEAPNYLRDTYWLLPHPNGKDVIRIPKPFESAAYFSNPVEHLLRENDGIGGDINEHAREWLVSNVFFNPSLNVLTPIMEFATGKDSFTGGDVVPRREQGDPTSMQKDITTSHLAEGVGGLLNKLPILEDTKITSPRHIDNLLQGYFPVGGESAINSAEAGLEGMGILPEKNLPTGSRDPMAPVSDIGKQFTVKTEGKSSPLVGEAYEAQTKMKSQKKQDGGEFLDPGMKDRYKYMNKQVKAISDLSKEIRAVLNTEDMDPDFKRDKIAELTNQRNEIARMLEEQGMFDLTK